MVYVHQAKCGFTFVYFWSKKFSVYTPSNIISSNDSLFFDVGRKPISLLHECFKVV